MTAKTTAQRQREYVQRQKEAGLKQIRNLWARPEDEARIRAYVERLNKIVRAMRAGPDASGVD